MDDQFDNNASVSSVGSKAANTAVTAVHIGKNVASGGVIALVGTAVLIVLLAIFLIVVVASYVSAFKVAMIGREESINTMHINRLSNFLNYTSEQQAKIVKQAQKEYQKNKEKKCGNEYVAAVTKKESEASKAESSESSKPAKESSAQSSSSTNKNCYIPWSSHFTEYCLKLCGIKCDNWDHKDKTSFTTQLNTDCEFYSINGNYIPRPGDIVFWSKEPDGTTAEHCGIITEINCTTEGIRIKSCRLTVIEGNVDGDKSAKGRTYYNTTTVAQHYYDLFDGTENTSYSSDHTGYLIGYASVAQDYEAEESTNDTSDLENLVYEFDLQGRYVDAAVERENP